MSGLPFVLVFARLTYRLDSQVLEISTERRHPGTVSADTAMEDNFVVAFDGMLVLLLLVLLMLVFAVGGGCCC